MVLYLVIISLILNLATILWIVVLMQKINQPSLENETIDADKVTREIEDLLIAYTAEMKAENEKLMSEFILSKEEKKRTESSYEAVVETEPVKNPSELEIKQSEVSSTEPIHKERMNEREKDDNVKAEERFSDYQPPSIQDAKEDIYEQSDTLKVLTLAKQGLNIEEIAKKLKMGKGEVELLLKFYR